MEIGFVGLGRMGGNMVRRLQKGDHKCHIYSETAETRNGVYPNKGTKCDIGLSLISDAHDCLPAGFKMACNG